MITPTMRNHLEQTNKAHDNALPRHPVIGSTFGVAPERETLGEAMRREQGAYLWAQGANARKNKEASNDR